MKTLKQVEVEPVFFDEALPSNTDIEFGKLYISRRFMCLNHKCLCGCGQDTSIPLKSINGDTTNGWKLHGWDLTTDASGRVSLSPSLLHRFECQSHYIITKNKANFV
jgi:hypothetical protein